jgi:hypothetical protein
MADAEHHEEDFYDEEDNKFKVAEQKTVEELMSLGIRRLPTCHVRMTDAFYRRRR